MGTFSLCKRGDIIALLQHLGASPCRSVHTTLHVGTISEPPLRSPGRCGGSGLWGAER
jgi:hypothetical protein